MRPVRYNQTSFSHLLLQVMTLTFNPVKSLTTLAAAALAALAIAPCADASSVLDITSHLNDSTVVLPESFETDTHKMMENWYLRTYTALDEDVERRPDAPVSDEVIIQRLAAIPTTIELPFNSIVRAYIDAYTQKNRRLVENMLGMSIYYSPIFEQALEKQHLPLELKYLPVIESAMNPEAVSRSGATGLWQLMMSAARGLGMEVNTLVDERRDPVVSSEKAAELLRQLYDIYHDWSLAIAAYNCGPGNVNKAMRRCNAEHKDFWTIYPYLPKETRGYVPCFIAATYVMTYHKEHNISPALARKPLLTDSVHVTRRIYFPQISEVLNIPVEELKVLNPQYRQECIPGDIRPYPLVLPQNLIYSYVMSENAIAANNADIYARRLTAEPSTEAADAALASSADAASSTDPADGEWVTTEKVIWHKVKKGETMSSIAKRYGVSLWSLKNANGNRRTARRGETLKVVTTERTFKANSGEPTPPPEGDNLLVKNPAQPAAGNAAEPVAAATEEASTEAAGSVESTEPQAAPAPAPEVKPAPAPAKKPAASSKKNQKKRDTTKTVTAKSGDSLARIAKKNGTTVEKLKKLNGLKGANPTIQPGQKIRVK